MCEQAIQLHGGIGVSETGEVYFDSGLVRLLAVNSIPTTVILDQAGRVVSRMNGFNGGAFVDQLTARIEAALAAPGGGAAAAVSQPGAAATAGSQSRGAAVAAPQSGGAAAAAPQSGGAVATAPQ